MIRFDEIGYWSEIKLDLVRDYAHLSPAHLRKAVDKLAGLTPGRRPEFSTTSAHEVESEPARSVSPRHAGVAQWQSS
jgi:hypothetical protein